MHPLQAMLNGLSQQEQEKRSATQMTLGDLIERLKEFDPHTKIEGLTTPHSYRGYYEDLAFEPSDEFTTAGELLVFAQGCMGEVFYGYKGGDYQMGRNTPVWVAEYGSTGEKIIGIKDNGSLDLEEDSF